MEETIDLNADDFSRGNLLKGRFVTVGVDVDGGNRPVDLLYTLSMIDRCCINVKYLFITKH